VAEAPLPEPDEEVVDLLATSARMVPDRSWVFVGFNWPMLAARTARRLGRAFTEVYEAGAACDSAPDLMPTSTTDYAAYHDSLCWTGTTTEVLTMVPRFAAVLLDAAQVDVDGRVSTFGDGSSPGPRGRSAGGGGSADAAGRARRLVLLHSSSRPDAITRAATAPTAVPGPHAETRLVTRWGTIVILDEPLLVELADGPRADRFRSHVAGLGVDVSAPAERPLASDTEREAAVAVLTEAASRGYRGARAALGLH